LWIVLQRTTDTKTNKEEQKNRNSLYYSGKREKKYTVKNLFCKSKGTDNLVQNKTEAER